MELEEANAAPDGLMYELLREFAGFADRAYYDEAGDTASWESYYEGINGDSRDLYAALSNLLRETHARPLDYSPAKHLYPWVDVRPNGQIISIYSQTSLDPAELIRADIETDRQRVVLNDILTAQFTPVAFRDDDMLRQRRRDTVERQLPYNCEHVVPQSWFGKRTPMRGDLHHLFACEIRCNGFRGNTPYFDFPDTERALKDDCGESLSGGFEPFGGKGAVARGTLYFLLRYPDEINNTKREYTADALKTLLNWHKSHAVTLYERHRNAAIAEKQGNRNPLIDHPEWAERIAFAHGLG